MLKNFLDLRSALDLFGERSDRSKGKAYLDIGSSEFLAREPLALTELVFNVVKVKPNLRCDECAERIAVFCLKLLDDAPPQQRQPCRASSVVQPKV